MNGSTYNQLVSLLGKNQVRQNETLALHTTFKMGGPAEYYFEAYTENDLAKAVKASAKLNLPLTILGGASNVIVSDEGIKGLIIHNRYSEKKIVKETQKAVYLRVSSGYSMTRLAKETAEAGLSGLEYHCGLPGTVGGALYMNSKWTKPVAYVGEAVYEAKLLNKEGNDKIVKKNYFQFAYDVSIIQKTKEIIVWVDFKLSRENPKLLIERYKKSLNYRKKTQPHGVASSGCFFRNMNDQSAGKLIDKLGLKGFAVGNLYISNQHANFIINKGGGSADDFKKLVKHIKKVAQDKMGIKLEEEVIFIK